MTTTPKYAFNYLSDDEAAKLSKLTRAQLVLHIDQVLNEVYELKTQTIQYKFDDFVNELHLLWQDLQKFSRFLQGVGGSFRKSFDAEVLPLIKSLSQRPNTYEAEEGDSTNL